MAKPSKKLAESVEVLHQFQERGLVAIRSGDLSRTNRGDYFWQRLWVYICLKGFLAIK